MNLREERMWDGMTKHHIDGLMGAAVHHDFTLPDTGDPHDHPWNFISHVLFGSYVEEIFAIGAGHVATVHRKEGDVFFVPATHIHRVIELPEGRCNTLIKPQPGFTQKSGFYQFREDGTWHRFWDGDWSRR